MAGVVHRDSQAKQVTVFHILLDFVVLVVLKDAIFRAINRSSY